MQKNKIIILIISFYIFWLGILPVIISKSVTALCKNFSHNSDYIIEIVNPVTRLSLLPTATFKVDKITVKDKKQAFTSDVKDFKLRIRLLPLLSGKLHINNLDISSVKLSANIQNDMELDRNFFEKLEHTRIKCNSIGIKDFEILLYQKDVKTPIQYQGKDFKYKHKNRYIQFGTKSTLKVNDKISTANIELYLPKNNDIKKTVFDIEVTNLDVAPLRIYFKHYLPNDLIELKGFININADKNGLITELKNCTATMKDSSKSIILPETLQIKSKFNIKKSYITLDSVDIESRNIKASLGGKIYNYFGKTMPTLDLNIRLNKSKIEDIINMLPAFRIEEIDVQKLKQYKFYGNILANLSIKGRLPEPDINGEIYINDGILMKPIPNTTKGATIKLKLTGKYANFDVFVPAGQKESVQVRGSQEIYNIKYADMTVKSSSNVDLAVAESVVNPLHEILNFIIGPVPIMDIKGKGNIDITVKGNRKNPHVWGTLNVNNTTVKFNQIPDLILTNSDAVLTFNNQDAIFTSKKGLVNGKDFKINGTCNLFGKFDFNAVSQNQPTEALYRAIQTSTMIPDIKKMIPETDKIQGLTDLNIKVFGEVKYIEDLEFNKNTFVKGHIILKDNDFCLKGLEINKTNGDIKFDTDFADANITALMGNSPLSVKAKIKNNIGDLVLNIPRFNPNFLIENANNILPYISINAKYKGDINKIEYNKLNLKAKILESNAKSEIKFQTGEITVQNNIVTIDNLKGYITNSTNMIEANLRISEAFSKKFSVNGAVRIKTPDLSMLNNQLLSDLLPKTINDIEFKKGAVDLNCKFFNNKISANSDLSGISFIYLPLELPIEIINGNLAIRNNSIRLNKVNLIADRMPILADGEIKDIFDKQTFNLYINSKPQQEFIDKYINKNQIYPIKIKGDIVYWLRLRGTPENYELKSKIDMSKDSSVYHFGATVGDIENAIVMEIDSRITNKKNIKIQEFAYDKLIDSQNGKQTRLNMLKAHGNVQLLNEDLGFNDLVIKTYHPTDARIFNIIFRKPNIKQGQFTSDLRFNGKLSNPRIIGDFHIFETNIPFMDTTMKNIELVFKDKVIEISSKGDILGNGVKFEGIMKNKLTVPYELEKATIYTKDLNLNNIVNKLKTAQADNVSTFESFEGFDLNSIVFNNLKLKADSIQLRNINATEFEALTSLNEKGIFDVSDFNFNIAQGSLSGKYQYNLKNNEASLNIDAQDINANDITWALFDLNNQIYGDLTGTINLSCNGANFQNCMETLRGNTIFNVKNGRMPKLGSLEYLLKAGNLLKGGLTGVSINSVIDIITPLKTGEFSDIFGSIRIKDGVARNIEITTKGKDLSLFIGGTYRFADSTADMEVLGLLSRKISTMFGPIGNMSINTLFNVIPGVDLSKDSLVLERINKIPGIELSEKAYRKFIAEIKGNINGDNYVTSFKWVN